MIPPSGLGSDGAGQVAGGLAGGPVSSPDQFSRLPFPPF